MVKHDAARLFREILSRDSWIPEPIIFCLVTSCDQPAERDFRLTRQCLEVEVECNQRISIITKETHSFDSVYHVHSAGAAIAAGQTGTATAE